MAMHREYGVNVGIARIFNTYGPRLTPGDGRVVSNFIAQALRGDPLTVYGDGSQTRSLCYVDDEIAGLIALLDSSLTGPVNIGNPDERTVLELAQVVLEVTGSHSTLVFEDLPTDDPTRRCPDISLATEQLGWMPVTQLRDGIARTVEYLAPQVVGA
jgi:UDP-glucuronate decarboxylase